jgi:hypothetical protein
LEALEDFKAAAATLALERIGRIGDQLKFVEDETGNAERAIEEVGFADFGDATVNEDAGVEKFQGRQRALGRNRDRMRQGNLTKDVALAGADNEAKIAESKECGEFEKGPGGFGLAGVGNDEGNEEGSEQTKDGTDGASQQPADLRATKP